MRRLAAAVLAGLVAAGCATHTTITAPSVRGHLKFMASDAMNGRGSDTRDEWIAAAYVASQLRRWGVEPLGDDGGFVQAVQLSRAQITAPPVLAAEGLRLTHGQEMLVQGLTSLHITGSLQRFQLGTPVAAGAIVLLPEDAGVDAAASTDNAAAVLTIENAQSRARWDVQGGRTLLLPARIVALPVQPAGFGWPTRITLDRASYAAIAALAAGTIVSMEAAGTETTSYVWNSVGRPKGRDAALANDVILLTAHLDHLGGNGTGPDKIFNGADDDASGSAAVLELAEALAKGKRPKRTVMFAWFGSEEAGGYGARYFVERPPVPLERIIANLEFEMIGRADQAVAAHALTHRLRAQQPRPRTRPPRRAHRHRSASRPELLRALGQIRTRAQGHRRAAGIELRAAHRLPPGDPTMWRISTLRT